MSVASIRRAISVTLVSLTLAGVLPAQDVAKELMKLEDQWGAASIKRDGATVAKMLSDNYLAMYDNGQPSSKQKLVASINGDTTHYISGTNSGFQVKVHGNTAVIVGVWTAVTKGAKGNVTQKGAWTDTWMKQPDGKWLCIASQSTPVK